MITAAPRLEWAWPGWKQGKPPHRFNRDSTIPAERWGPNWGLGGSKYHHAGMTVSLANTIDEQDPGFWQRTGRGFREAVGGVLAPLTEQEKKDIAYCDPGVFDHATAIRFSEMIGATPRNPGSVHRSKWGTGSWAGYARVNTNRKTPRGFTRRGDLLLTEEHAEEIRFQLIDMILREKKRPPMYLPDLIWIAGGLEGDGFLPDWMAEAGNEYAPLSRRADFQKLVRPTEGG